MAPSARTVELREIAQAIADAMPGTVVEAVVTGSVSRGVADELSDIEMLLVTHDELDLEGCFTLARGWARDARDVGAAVRPHETRLR